MAVYIKVNTNESDLIYAFPQFPSIYFLSERLGTSRHMYFSWVIWEKIKEDEIITIIEQLSNAKFVMTWYNSSSIDVYENEFLKS